MHVPVARGLSKAQGVFWAWDVTDCLFSLENLAQSEDCNVDERNEVGLAITETWRSCSLNGELGAWERRTYLRS